jgi:hypothetical protein
MNNCSILLYSEVQAPDPPQWLLDIAQSSKTSSNTQAAMNNWSDDYTARPIYKDGKMYNNAFNHSVYLNDDCLAWARQNVTRAAKDIRIAATKTGLERSGAHIDRTRNYTLMFLLEPGGPDHETVFYKERGVEEIVRPNTYHVDHYDQLEVLRKFKLKINAWNLVQARVLHSIENISQGRSSIQISLDKIDSDLILTNTQWYDAY